MVTGTVRLLQVEPDLGAGLAGEALRRAAAEGVFEVTEFAAGPIALQAEEPSLLILDGFLLRELYLEEDRPAAQVVGPGDIVDLLRVEEALPCRTSWSALTPVRAAVLGERFARYCVAHQSVGAAVRRRLADQSASALLVAAITALPRVEQRVLALLWVLAGRWGTMGADGAALPLPLTHDLLGRLIGSRRSTVTLALGKLAEHGTVTRRDDGTLVLRRGSQRDVATAGNGHHPASRDLLVAELASLAEAG